MPQMETLPILMSSLIVSSRSKVMKPNPFRAFFTFGVHTGLQGCQVVVVRDGIHTDTDSGLMMIH